MKAIIISFLIALLVLPGTLSFAQYEIWETQLDVDNYTHLDRIFFLNENYGWAIGGNTIGSASPYFFTTDAGENWYLDQNCWDNWGTDIVFVNQDTGFIACGNGTILKTINGGQNWISIQTPATQHLIKLFFVDENNGWATLGQYSEGNILHTIDGGDSWVLKSVFYDFNGNISNIFFINESTGWASGSAFNEENNYVLIKKTTNGGESWETLDSLNNLSDFYMDIYFSDSSNGWIVGSHYSNYLIRNTVDGGANWIEQEILTIPEIHDPSIINCVYFADDTTGWIGTSGVDGGAIYFTNNGGQNWQFQQEFPQAVYDIRMLSRNTGWAVGGDFIYHTTNGSFVTNVIENHIEEEVFKAFPNPARDIITIQLPDTFISPGILTIYNNFGETVLRRNISRSTSSFTIDVSNFVNGIYFQIMNSSTINVSNKLIVQH